MDRRRVGLFFCNLHYAVVASDNNFTNADGCVPHLCIAVPGCVCRSGTWLRLCRVLKHVRQGLTLVHRGPVNKGQQMGLQGGGRACSLGMYPMLSRLVQLYTNTAMSLDVPYAQQDGVGVAIMQSVRCGCSLGVAHQDEGLRL